MALWPWLLFSLATSLPTERPEVTAPAGRLRGISEGEVHVFRGIPYAQAPLGELRWRPPVPFKPWQGVRDASHYGNRCMSAGDKESREDCLFLNVYTPSSSSTRESTLPCLVWIHGGGFEFGSSDLYNGSSLVNFWSQSQSPALLVTMNYRLNIFGFIGSEKLRDRDPLRSTGNYGIQDQRMALRWVQENIGAFGGDPKKVTIFGQSAGAGSVSMHLSMPQSFGLYAGALMESGGFSGWTAQSMSRKELWFQRLMNQTQCQDLDCLLTLPTEELFSAYLAIPQGRCCKESLLGDPFIPWAPAIDGVELQSHPLDLLIEEKVNQVPMVIGSTVDDGALFFQKDYNLSGTDFLTLFESKYKSSRAPAELYSSEPHDLVPGLADGWWSAERVVTDQNFFCSSHFARRTLAPSTPIFGYLFAHSKGGNPVVTHSDDLPFVFMGLPKNASSEDHQLAAEVAMSWNRFASSGQPDVPDTWPRQSSKAAPILKFQVSSKGGNQVIDGNFREQQCAFMMRWLNSTLRDDFTPAATSVATLPTSQPKLELQEVMDYV